MNDHVKKDLRMLRVLNRKDMKRYCGSGGNKSKRLRTSKKKKIAGGRENVFSFPFIHLALV